MDGFGGDFGGSSSSAPTPSGNSQAELQASMNQLVLQLLQNQTRKTCFDKCFGDTFSATLEQKDQVCLAKCMDRMFEAHGLVAKATQTAAQAHLDQMRNSGMPGMM